ncbi:MAG TPA: hypothetical protein VE153_16035 [Myxococcus sp.]|jgi:hypothetical protein|nr:hypothetical protein [Myxococcus sp.]
MAHDDRWANLVNAAFLLDQSPRRPGPEGLRPALTLLASALEVFPPAVDPVEDFEGYAVRRLLLALEAVLSEQVSPPSTD